MRRIAFAVLAGVFVAVFAVGFILQRYPTHILFDNVEVIPLAAQLLIAAALFN